MKKADHHLVQQVLEGAVSAEEFHDFQGRLRREPAMLKLYGEYALLHHSLCEELEHQTSAGEVAVLPRKFAGVKIVWCVLAALGVVLAAYWVQNHLTPVPQTAGVGGMKFSLDAVWSVDGPSTDPQRLVVGSTLRLQQGQAEVSLGDVATALLDGPAVMRFEASSEVNLSEGRGRFHSGDSSRKLKVTTPQFTVVDRGGEFGVEATANGYVALHVIGGRVSVLRAGGQPAAIFSAGEGLGLSNETGEERFPTDPSRFKNKRLQFREVFAGPLLKADWRVSYGSPLLEDGGITGENYSAFFKLSPAEPAAAATVFLASLEVGEAADGAFHTEGWSGMSLFRKGEELIFFGDTFGTDGTWSLDVKQRTPVIMPENKVSGPKTVTLRYDKSTGEVSLHEGGLPLRSAFCRGKLTKDVEFDEIRLGASYGASLDVRSLTLRVGAW